VVVIVVATRPQRPDTARGPADPAKMPGNDKQPLIPPAAAAGPHAAIMEEFAASWDNAANALAQARDEGSASGAANQLRQEATKLDQLTQRLRAAGRVSDNDAPAVRQIQQRMEPNVPRLETEMNQLRQRMPGMRLAPGTANDLDQGIRAFQTSGRNFTSAGRQLLP